MFDEIRGVIKFVYMLLELPNRPIRRLLVLLKIEGFSPPSSLKNSPTTEALSRLCRFRRAGDVGAGDRRYWSRSVSVCKRKKKIIETEGKLINEIKN